MAAQFLIPAAINVAAGIAGNLVSSGDRSAAANAANQAISELLSIGMPPDQAREIVYEQFKSAGVLTPELEQAFQLGPSAVAGIEEDPMSRDAQVSALQLLQQSGRGLSPQDRMKFNQLRDEVQRDAEAKRLQILQEYRQRGMGGSGAELATQLSQAQNSANSASLEGDRIAAASAENALNAIRQSGDMASNLRSQDFDVARTKATAEDEFAKFNMQNRAGVQARNIASRNRAQESNLNNAQRIRDNNTNMRNNELLRQREAERQYWQDQMTRAQMRAGAYQGQSANHSNNANRTANQWVGAGRGIAEGVSAYNQANKPGELELEEDKTGTSYGGFKPINNI